MRSAAGHSSVLFLTENEPGRLIGIMRPEPSTAGPSQTLACTRSIPAAPPDPLKSRPRSDPEAPASQEIDVSRSCPTVCPVGSRPWSQFGNTLSILP